MDLDSGTRPRILPLVYQWWIVASGVGIVLIFCVDIEISGTPQILLDAMINGHEVVAYPTDFVQAAQYYEAADATADAERAVHAGDRRLWAVGLSSSDIPGVEEG